MKKIPIRNLLSIPREVVRDGLKVSGILVYEDGVEVISSANEIIMMRYIFTLLDVMPELPIVSKYHVTHYYSNNIYVAKTFNKLFEVLLEDYIMNVIGVIDIEKRLELVYLHMEEVFNIISNDVVHNKLDYATSLNIDDFLEIQMDNRLLESIKIADKEKTLKTITDTHDVLDTVIRDPKYAKNILAKSYVAGTVNPNQVKQMLASRGYVTEIDSSIFKVPIASSFTLGLNNIYDLSVESRSGAKALFLSNKAIQDSEYFAREMQLVSMSVEKLIHGDCGNTEYIKWLVRDKSYTGKSDLNNLVGKYYLNEETGKEEVITSKHKHLLGKSIQLRTSLTCKLENKKHVCSKCFGTLSYSIFSNTGLGHICTTTLTKKITQSILSTKHLTGNATSASIALDEISKKFFSVKNKNGLALRSTVLNKTRSKMLFIINQNEGFGLKDINSNTSIYKLNLARISRIESIIIRMEYDTGKVEEIPIIVKQINRYGNFTHNFLKHLAKVGYTLTDKDEYLIDMSTFDSTEPIMTLPQVEFSFLSLAKSIKKEFKSMEVVKGKYSQESPESLLQTVFDLINYKLDVNIALIEVIIYSFTIRSYEDNNYDLSRNSTSPQMAKIADILGHRSLSASLTHERSKPVLFNSMTTGRNGVDHPLDCMFMPAETLKDYGEL